MQKKRAIASARAFLNSPFDLLVDIVGLNPKEDWHLWVDAEGNRLRIAKNKSVQVYPAREESTCTKDVFRKASPYLIAKNSYWVLALFGKNQTLLNFLGDDGTLRSCYFKDEIWQYNMSSTLLGYKALRYISSGYVEIYSRQIMTSLKVKYPKGFEIEEAWASGYPSSNAKLQERIQCHLTNPKLMG